MKRRTQAPAAGTVYDPAVKACPKCGGMMRIVARKMGCWACRDCRYERQEDPHDPTSWLDIWKPPQGT